VQAEVRHGSRRYEALLGGNIPKLEPRPVFHAHVRVNYLAVGEEPRPQARVFNALGEHPLAFRQGRTTPARPARLWSVLAVHGLAKRGTIFGPAVSFFVFELREQQRPTRSAIGGSRSDS
jgi:hypothetical protein